MARRSWLIRYSFAAIVTVLAIILVSVAHVSSDSAATDSILLAVVMLMSWLGGLGAGLVSTVVGTLAPDFVVSAPITFPGGTRLVQLSAFVAVALLISSLNHSRRRATAILEAERARLEDAVENRTADLSRAERNFRGLIESAPDAIVAIDATGNIMKVNDEMERMFGYTRERLLETSVELIIPERFRQRHVHAQQRYHLNSQRRTIAGDLFGVRADGSEVPVEIRVSALESDEGALIVGVIRDVSERANAQRVQQRLVHDLGERVKELTARPNRRVIASRVAVPGGDSRSRRRRIRGSGDSRLQIDGVGPAGQLQDGGRPHRGNRGGLPRRASTRRRRPVCGGGTHADRFARGAPLLLL